MKLYYAPGACSLCPHIVAREARISLELEKVDTKTKRTETGSDFLSINPKGYVPALELVNGEVLTEGPTIVQYLADESPNSGLAPLYGTFDRVRLQEILGYINSEIHKSYIPLLRQETPDITRAERKEYLRKRYAFLENILTRKRWLLGDHYSVADPYLFTVTRWAHYVGLDLASYEALAEFQQRVAERPAVRAALLAEGL